jgi:hypothetical protein
MNPWEKLLEFGWSAKLAPENIPGASWLTQFQNS